MDLTFSPGSQYHRNILDAMPHPIIIVEEGGRIIDTNAAATQIIAITPAGSRQRRPGDALGCIHARTRGCGNDEVCKTCPINTALRQALETQSTARRIVKITVASDEGVHEQDYLMSTAPLQFENMRLAVLVLEDLRELNAFRQTLPVCCHCKQIRDAENDWQSLESYLARHLEINFTHSLCPDCARKYFPEYADALRDTSTKRPNDAPGAGPAR